MGRQRRAGGLAEALDDVEHARRDLRLGEHLGQQRRGQRRPLGGLEYDGVAGRERGSDPPRGEHQRRVPGHDQPGHADRLAERVVDELVADLERAAVELGDDSRVVVEVLRGAVGEPVHLRDRQADVAHLGLDQLGRALADAGGDTAQHRGPLLGLGARPLAVVEGAPGGLDRRVDVGLAPVGDVGEDRVGRGIKRLERAGGLAGHELTVYVVALKPIAMRYAVVALRRCRVNHHYDPIRFLIGNERKRVIPDIGRVGVWSRELRFYSDRGVRRDAAAELEELGYSALFIPDVGGDVFGACGETLAATRSVPVLTGILNIWMHSAADVAAGVASLGQRFVLGLGASHSPVVGERYARPLSAMRAYLDELDAAGVGERFLAALGPRMLELSRDRGIGAHPYLVTVAHTRAARELLGPDRLLAVEQGVVLSRDRGPARAH